ncbi:uncharacterized protein LOC131304890 isoform X1 [Rhododendron vialii]|uniref:uncharacterized protein LOC131304890 isoform X1 n=1 Tax=Rhododendron vialii TaxID=182163 RepID=UPI00265E1AF8|nr:uncharacterized protein LOC131304890 isoform X1 [Rhododendron vialii]
MASLSTSIVSVRIPQTHSSSDTMLGSSLMRVDQSLGSRNLFVSTTCQGKAKSLKYRKTLMVQASRDGGSSASIFVGGFLLGGVVVGTLGCIYAPEISKALVGEERRELIKKLPKYIHDVEENALEMTREVLAEKIGQLNSALEDVSALILGNDAPKPRKPHEAMYKALDDNFAI